MFIDMLCLLHIGYASSINAKTGVVVVGGGGGVLIVYVFVCIICFIRLLWKPPTAAPACWNDLCCQWKWLQPAGKGANIHPYPSGSTNK